MNVLISIDSFKGSLSSMEAGGALAEGIRRVYPDAGIEIVPLADGGEGTVDALVKGMGGILRSVSVTGPMGESVTCEYGLIPDKKTAVIEMSGAAGITLVPEEKRNPLDATTYGVGEVIRDAILNGARRFIIGIGGSATNDGGVGMLEALGYEFLDSKGDPVARGARGLEQIAAIKDTGVIAQLSDCEFKIACDVTNVLCGELGCSHIYGPQKGATPEMILKMDKWMNHYAEQTARVYPDADPLIAGTGAAGGLGFAFLAYTNASLQSGIKIVLEEIGLEDYMKKADIVITGEGRLDEQTVMGKAPAGVAALAKKHGKPVIAFAGMVTPEARICNEHGIDAFFPILRRVVTLPEAMEKKNSRINMADTAEQVFRAMQINLYGNRD